MSKPTIVICSSLFGLVTGGLTFFLLSFVIPNSHYQMTEEIIIAGISLVAALLGGVISGKYLEGKIKK